ncbi:hypothetical protein AcidC75_26810 [Acidisoma sp. C75]
MADRLIIIDDMHGFNRVHRLTPWVARSIGGAEEGHAPPTDPARHSIGSSAYAAKRILAGDAGAQSAEASR